MKTDEAFRRTVANLFDGYLTEGQVLGIASFCHLSVTDCLSDENPHYTIEMEEDGQPVWQLHKLVNGRFIVTDFDAEALAASPNCWIKLNERIEKMNDEGMPLSQYDLDLSGWTPVQVAEKIEEWRHDETAYFSEATDLLNSIEPWLRSLNGEEDDADAEEFRFNKQIAGDFLKAESGEPV